MRVIRCTECDGLVYDEEPRPRPPSAIMCDRCDKLKPPEMMQKKGENSNDVVNSDGDVVHYKIVRRIRVKVKMPIDSR